MSEQKQHPHYESMKLYLEDAANTDKPWLLWRCRPDGGSEWRYLNHGPVWDADTMYQRIPQTIRIGGQEVPKPLSEAPNKGTRYYSPAFDSEGMCFSHIWDGTPDWCQRLLDRGFVHLTQEAAVAHAKALIAISGGQCD